MFDKDNIFTDRKLRLYMKRKTNMYSWKLTFRFIKVKYSLYNSSYSNTNNYLFISNLILSDTHAGQDQDR